MPWQDWVLTLGSITFAISLLPSVFSKDKPAFFTSSITGIVLILFVVVYASLGLWFAAGVNTINSGLWLTLAVQKFLSNRSAKTSTV